MLRADKDVQMVIKVGRNYFDFICQYQTHQFCRFRRENFSDYGGRSTPPQMQLNVNSIKVRMLKVTGHTFWILNMRLQYIASKYHCWSMIISREDIFARGKFREFRAKFREIKFS